MKIIPKDFPKWHPPFIPILLVLTFKCSKVVFPCNITEKTISIIAMLFVY